MKYLTEPHDTAFGHDGPNNTAAGLTKREYFAALAMQGMCANHETGHFDYDRLAIVAVTQADALITALNEVIA